MKTVNVERITPVLHVKEVEPCVRFWVERLAFQKTAEVPEGDRLGFVILQKGNLEIMYQSIASAEKTFPRRRRRSPEAAPLYVEVDKLEAIIDAMKDANVVLPVRTTFYKEIGATDPAGHIVVFAEMSAAPQH